MKKDFTKLKQLLLEFHAVDPGSEKWVESGRMTAQEVADYKAGQEWGAQAFIAGRDAEKAIPRTDYVEDLEKNGLAEVAGWERRRVEVTAKLTEYWEAIKTLDQMIQGRGYPILYNQSELSMPANRMRDKIFSSPEWLPLLHEEKDLQSKIEDRSRKGSKVEQFRKERNARRGQAEAQANRIAQKLVMDAHAEIIAAGKRAYYNAERRVADLRIAKIKEIKAELERIEKEED